VTQGRRHPRKWPWIVLASLVVGVLVISAAIAYFGAQVLLTPHHGITTPAGDVVSLSDDEVTLPRSAASTRVGTYGLVWFDDDGDQAGTAIVGPVTESTDDTVTRPISNITGALAVGTSVELNPNIYEGDPSSSLGIPFTDVEIEGELGPMPAWHVDGTGSTWVLFVHGIDGERQSALRPLPTLVDAGYPTLMITYRNDIGAPPSPDGLIDLGQTEWRDLDSAAAYAVNQGAASFILYGDSMGGSIVTRFMHESEYADQVAALVLDSPVLKWSGVLDNQAESLHLGLLSGPLKVAVSLRGDIDLAQLNELDQTDTFEGLPILLFQGLADPLVPPAESRQFADSLPDAVFVPVAEAGHIQSWNVDPVAYEEHLSTFLDGLATR
jgi:alpha-beta hydrolase superfamily lysophospholipase